MSNIKTCPDGFQYDDAMWTEKHAREISSLAGSRLFRYAIYAILLMVAACVVMMGIGIYIAINR